MVILQINTVVNSGSTGRITEDIGRVMLNEGHESYIAYGRGERPSESVLIKIGTKKDLYLHGVKTALLDRHGFGSEKATKALIRKIDEIKPDVIGLHNLHGYYLNIEILFDYLSKQNIPVLWTLFDCWAFTGHCTYFDDIDCKKWQTECHHCPKTRKYPSSYFLDNSKRNYADKQQLFTSVKNLHIVAHSRWLSGLVKKSFLKQYPVHFIPSGIDLEMFRPMESNLKRSLNIEDKKVVLGVASPWSERKGLLDFVALSDLLSSETQIVLIGLSKSQIKSLPKRIIGIERTESVEQLAQYYSMADVFVNPTYQDNFPTTNIEALACGTPVVTYDTGGSPEAIDEQTGLVVKKGDLRGVSDAVKRIVLTDKETYRDACRERAVNHFNKDDRYRDYLGLYEKLKDTKV